MNPNIQTDASGFEQIRRKSTKQSKNDIQPAKKNIEYKPSNTPQPTDDLSGRFFDRPNYLPDPLEYSRKGDDPGLVLIFNQEDFQGEAEFRQGSRKDVHDLFTCLGRLGFNMKQENVHTDLSKKELFEKVDEVLNSDLSQINSVLVFILSHGKNCNTIQTRERSFKLDDILRKFNNCEALRGKPKMFAIQACKGRDRTLSSTEVGDRMIVPLSTFEEIYPDMLIIYSTLEGKRAFRDSLMGTWLIQEICRNFTAFGRRDDVLSLCTRVVKCVISNYYQSQPDGKVQKQMPVVVSTLSKKFYLNTNKDRDFTLRTTIGLQEILYGMRNLSKKIENFTNNPV